MDSLYPLFWGWWHYPEHSVNFQIEPPFPLRFWLPVLQYVVRLNDYSPGDGDMPYDPIDRPVQQGVTFVPGADLYAGAASSPVLVARPHTDTLFDIEGPPLIAVMDYPAVSLMCRDMASGSSVRGAGWKPLRILASRQVPFKGKTVITGHIPQSLFLGDRGMSSYCVRALDQRASQQS